MAWNGKILPKTTGWAGGINKRPTPDRQTGRYVYERMDDLKGITKIDKE
jgi:hypothetical protein